MALSIWDYTIIKEAQATHHQGDVRYSTLGGIKCSRMCLMSVTWTLFKSPGIWDYFDLDSIVVKGISCLNLLENLDILGWKIFHKGSW